MAGPKRGPTKSPVIVFGALRSGTTVFRLMLAAHPQINHPGEADFLFDYLEEVGADNWRYRLSDLKNDRIFRVRDLTIPPDLDGLDLLQDMLDQMRRKADGLLALNCHRHADLIARVMPGAKIIHLVRDPRDVARSSIGMGWAGNVFYGVNHWVKTETHWLSARSGFQADNLLDIKYEDMFQDTEAHLKAVCQFLDLPFSADMLRYHENTTYGPPDAKLTQQWRRKASAREVALVEFKAHHLMAELGYELAGPVTEPGRFERTVLRVRNKLAVWRFGAARYGFFTYFLEKLTRRMGARALHGHFRDKMAKRTIEVQK